MPRNLKKRGKIWWYRITKDGVTHEGSLQTEHLGTAQSRLQGLRQDLTGTKFGERPNRTFDDAARRFAAEHFKTLRPKSRLRYAVSLSNLTDHFQGVRLSAISSATLLDFEQARLKHGVTTSTVRRDLACLSSVFSQAEIWEWVTSNPVKPYLKKRAKSGLTEGAAKTRYLTVAEEAAILAVAPVKARPLIMFAIDTGLRKEEQAALVWSDIDFAASELTVRAEVAKSGKERRVPILPRSLAILEALPRGIGNAPVFTTAKGERYSPNSPTLWEALQKACRRAGVERCSWHDLRRTCGCRLLQEHKLIFDEVSKWLGHADVKITQQRYAFLRVQDLHRALKRPAKVVSIRSQLE